MDVGDDRTLRLASGETAVVGYGLLLARRTVDKTLGRPYDGPFATGHLDGWRRSWNASMPNQAFYFEDDAGRVYPERILYLNAHRQPGTRINVSVFVVGSKDLESLDAREWIYDRVPANDDLDGISVEGGEAVIYTCKEEHLVEPDDDPTRLAARRSFLRLLDRMQDRLEPQELSDWHSSTEAPPEHLLVDDQLDPTRLDPWAAAGQDFTPETPPDHEQYDRP